MATTLLAPGSAVSARRLVIRTHPPGRHPLPPVIVFGGNDNAISIVRSLAVRSIPVYVLNEPRADVQHSRYAQRLTLERGLPFSAAATKFLTSSDSDFLEGAVLLGASDEALAVI